MRRLMLMTAAGLLASTAAHGQARKPAPGKPAAAKPAPAADPVFSFLGEDTNTVTQRTELNGNACSVSGDGKTCSDYGSPKLGGADLKYLSLSFHKGLLYQVIGSSWTNRYSTLLEAFTAKYGPPKVEVKKWQAKSGATFDNAVASWRFKDATLQLSSLGADLNSLSIIFVSTANSPPREAPKVDF